MERKQLERNIILAVFQNKDLVDDLIENCKASYFRDDVCRNTMQWIIRQYTKNKRISIVQLKSQTEIDIEKIIDEDMLIFEFEDWLKKLHTLHIRDSLKRSAKEIWELAQNEELTETEYTSKAQEIIFSATTEFDNAQTDFYLYEALTEAFESYVEEMELGKVNGVKTEFVSIDNNIGGLKPGHLTVLAGSTSMGKTAFALSMANNLIKEGQKVHFITLEMNAKELADRLIIMNSNVRGKDYNRRKLTNVQKKAIDAARNMLTKYEQNIIISEKRGLTVEEIKANARKHYKQLDTDIIVIDYLQRIRLKGDRSTNKEVGAIANSIKDLAGELKIPIILLSQLNRKVDGKPKLKHLRDSGEIEEAADEVWFVYRSDYTKDPDKRSERQEGEIIHSKGRTTGVGKSSFYFYPELTLWVDGWLEDEGKVESREILKYGG